MGTRLRTTAEYARKLQASVETDRAAYRAEGYSDSEVEALVAPWATFVAGIVWEAEQELESILTVLVNEGYAVDTREARALIRAGRVRWSQIIKDPHDIVWITPGWRLTIEDHHDQEERDDAVEA